MESKTLSGDELEEVLASGETAQQSRAQITGMVRPSENSGYISFAQAGCDTWVDFPTKMIEDAAHLSDQPCKDRSYPVMRITLKELKSSEGKALASLLSQTASALGGDGEKLAQMIRSGSLRTGQLQGQSQTANAAVGSTRFASVPGKNHVTLSAPVGPSRPGAPGGGLGFIECDIDCCVACCRDCFPILGCVDYPCCELSNCKIKI